jgi:hypothetical protein
LPISAACVARDTRPLAKDLSRLTIAELGRLVASQQLMGPRDATARVLVYRKPVLKYFDALADKGNDGQKKENRRAA